MDLYKFQSQWLKHYYGKCAPKHKREQVYRRNYLFGSIQLLETTFPLLKRVLGKKNFQFFAKEYALTLPKSGPHFTEFGSGLSEFLENREELEKKTYLAEIAGMEWSWDWIKRENQGMDSPVLLLNEEAWFEARSRLFYVPGEAVQVRLDYGMWPLEWPKIQTSSGEGIVERLEPGSRAYALWSLQGL